MPNVKLDPDGTPRPFPLKKRTDYRPYTTIEAEHRITLEMGVNKALQEGGELVGGVSMITFQHILDGPKTTYCQAMRLAPGKSHPLP